GLATPGNIRQLPEARRHDVVVVDAPATGHGLGFLNVPRTFMRIARTGPVHSRAKAVAKVLDDPDCTAVVLVTTPEELPVSETIKAIHDLTAEGFPLAGVIANAVYEELFDGADAAALAGVDARGAATAAAAA